MSSQGNSRPLTLLVVEDDKEAIKILTVMIPRKFPDLAIHIATTGSAGMDLSIACPPDIVVTDVNMPGMDGIQMAEKIRAARPDTRLIIITGYSDEVHLNQFNEIGITDCISKPIEFPKLFAAIGKCICQIQEGRTG